MSDLKLFRTTIAGVTAISGGAVALEKSLQTLFEANLETLLGGRFLASSSSRTKAGAWARGASFPFTSIS